MTKTKKITSTTTPKHREPVLLTPDQETQIIFDKLVKKYYPLILEAARDIFIEGMGVGFSGKNDVPVVNHTLEGQEGEYKKHLRLRDAEKKKGL